MGKMDDELLLLTHKLLHATDYRGIKVFKKIRKKVKEKVEKAADVVGSVSGAVLPVTLINNFLIANT